MARKARVKSASDTYHIIVRGADRQRLFEESKDYYKYLDLLKRYKARYNFEIFAFCLMNNHIHLLIHTPYTSTETIFRCINTAYATWFNMKYNRTGFLLQGRYHSEAVETTEYLLACIRYIHKNPFNANLEAFPGESYPWSSFHDYVKKISELVNTDFILNLFYGYEHFLAFHNINSTTDNFIDVDKLPRRLPDDVAREIIENECQCKSASDFQKLSIEERNAFILLLHTKHGLSIRQLNRLTGISKGIISRIIAKANKVTG